MQNFSSLACTQTDFDTFLTIFEENSRIFQENSYANSEKFQIWVCNFLLNQAKHVYAKFQPFSLYPDGLRQIFDLLSRNIQDFLKENLEFSKSDKVPKRDFQSLSHFEPSSIFENFQNWFNYFFDSWVFKEISKFQNSEYEVHQVGSNEACSQNFSFLAQSRLSKLRLKFRPKTAGNAAWQTEK
jgi:hypothetical protein